MSDCAAGWAETEFPKWLVPRVPGTPRAGRARVVTATSNEPANGTGDGDHAPDVVVAGGAVEVRAERVGNGAGRDYKITATETDLALNSTTATAVCKVPHHGGL